VTLKSILAQTKGRIRTQPVRRSAFKALLNAQCFVLTSNSQFKCLQVTFKNHPLCTEQGGFKFHLAHFLTSCSVPRKATLHRAPQGGTPRCRPPSLGLVMYRSRTLGPVHKRGQEICSTKQRRTDAEDCSRTIQRTGEP